MTRIVVAAKQDKILLQDLHERLGFITTGQMPQVGIKFGRWLDLTFMQLTLNPGFEPPKE